MLTRLVETSLGRVVVYVDFGWIQASRFDHDGGEVAFGGAEAVDLADLLSNDLGIPQSEADAIAADVIAEWEREHGEIDRPLGGVTGAVAAGSIVVGFVAAAAVGAWTILRTLVRRLG